MLTVPFVDDQNVGNNNSSICPIMYIHSPLPRWRTFWVAVMFAFMERAMQCCRCLDAVHYGQPLAQLGRELLNETGPIFFTNLHLKTVQDLQTESALKSLAIFEQVTKPVPCTFCNISCRSFFGVIQEAAASQKKIKSGTTPTGLTVII